MTEYFYSLTWTDLLTLLSFVVGGFVIGWIADRVVLNRLRAFAARSAWEGDDVIIAAIKGVAPFWGVMAGIYAALLTIVTPPEVLVPARKIIVFVVLFSATIIFARIAGGLAGIYGRRAIGAERSASIFVYIARLTAYVIGLLIILQSIGVSIAPILTALGVGGLAVALALQDTLGNLFAGISIISARKILIGQYIKLDSGQEGYVTDITWRYTEIRALSNQMILIPNAKLGQSIVTNYYVPDLENAVSVNLGVAIDSDLALVERVTIEVATEVMKEVKGGVANYEPSIRYGEFAESTIRFGVNMRSCEFVDQYLIKHEFIKRLQARYKKEGIVIPFPTRTLYVANGLDVNVHEPSQ